MGFFQRENGYYYLRISTPSGEKRISLETKDKAFAQDIYQAYPLDRIKKKIIPELIPALVSAPAENSLSPQSKKPLITLSQGIFYAQEAVPKKTPLKFGRDYISFRHAEEDKYFQGWQNPHSFISRLYINYNFQLKDALISRNPAAQGNWNFQGISSLLNGRIATEPFLIRTPWVALGMGAAIDIPLGGVPNRQL